MSKIIKTKLLILDFDGCLIDSPEKETGIPKWVEHHGKPYPYPKGGWWSKPESLCPAAFNIQPFDTIHDIFKAAGEDTITIMLTNRMKDLSEPINTILKNHDIKFDIVSFKHGFNKTKGERIDDFIKKYPGINHVAFYDDMTKYLETVTFLPGKYPNIDFEFYLVTKGEIKIYEKVQ